MSLARAGAVLCLVSIGSAALANDSTASLDMGGLQFINQTDVSMLEEELFLSLPQVRIRYVFENKTDEDVVTTVAFPMPPVETGEGGVYAIDQAPKDPINFIRFKVLQDGKPVPVQTQVRASANGVDITAMLTRLGLPLTTIMSSDEYGRFDARLDAMPEEARRELSVSGAVSYFLDRSKNPPSWDGNAQWTASIVFYWPQTFPAHSKVELVQTYRPVPYSSFTGKDDIRDPDMRKAFCVDKGFERAVAALVKKEGDTLSRRDLHYVLTTGNNWKGAIGSFSLTIERPTPKAVLSTCFKGLKPDGPNRFVFKARDFEPTDDIALFFASELRDDPDPPADP